MDFFMILTSNSILEETWKLGGTVDSFTCWDYEILISWGNFNWTDGHGGNKHFVPGILPNGA